MRTKVASRRDERKPSLGRYAGQWVAFVNGRILFHHPNLKALMKEAKMLGLEKKVSVFLVPRKDEGPYILGI